MKRPALLLAILLLLMLGLLAFKGRLLALPNVRSEARAGEFDTARAIGRLQRILGDQRPHPADSAANDAVRARLVAELRAIGLSARITDHFACNGAPDTRAMGCGRVRNVVATIGPAQGRHLLIVSHYDSTAVGPGAADDGIGVATMLEIAAQLSRRDLKRPVSFLFNEGEEAGLLGARAFVDRDPLAGRVGSVINLEARGVEGPAIMFETSRPNGAAIDWFARSVRRPVANSLSTDFYKLIPNSTDVRVFEEREWTILNFAVIGNETRYHSPGDDLAALSRRSVQHMGDQALALASDHASGRAAAEPGTQIFADLYGRALVVIPEALGLLGLAGLLAVTAYLAWRRRIGLGYSLGAVLLAMIGSAALVFVVHSALRSLSGGEFWRAYPEATGIAIALIALFASSAALLALARKVSTGALRAAYWLVFLLLGAAISAAAPGASIFFLLPPLVTVIGMALGGKAAQPLATFAALLLLLLWTPLLALVEILLDFDNAWAFAPLYAVLMLPALIEMRALAQTLPARAAGAVLGIAALASWAVAAALPDYSDDRKQSFGIEYLTENGGKARWLVVNDGAALPPEFLEAGRFASDFEVPWSTRKRWARAAPPGLARPPGLEMLAQRMTTEGRAVSFRLKANGAESVTLFAPPAARVRAVSAGGWARRMGQADDPEKDAAATGVSRHYFLRCRGRSCDGLRVDMVLASQTPVEWTVIGSRAGLPEAARALLVARPVNAAPQYTADATIGVTKLRF